jgi:hypothetical protein
MGRGDDVIRDKGEERGCGDERDRCAILQKN